MLCGKILSIKWLRKRENTVRGAPGTPPDFKKLPQQLLHRPPRGSMVAFEIKIRKG
jgi:hypothetical protein